MKDIVEANLSCSVEPTLRPQTIRLYWTTSAIYPKPPSYKTYNIIAEIMSKKRILLSFFLILLLFVSVVLVIPILAIESIDKVKGLRWTTKSSAEAKERGVFERYMKPSSYRIEHKGLYTIIIKEVYVEKYWTCGPRCKTAENIGDADVGTLVVTLQKGANAGDLQGEYFIYLGDSRESLGIINDSVLIANIYQYPQQKDKPIKLYFYKGKTNFRKNKTLIDSLSIN